MVGAYDRHMTYGRCVYDRHMTYGSNRHMYLHDIVLTRYASYMTELLFH